ncbi:hypothetical protein [Streptomyces sp. NPDC087300]|uniref:hypothetical protein n=1 Tax=Streptomyces sp. NPDC087300 TaxID=3365780 RepID=UPI00381C7AB4
MRHRSLSLSQIGGTGDADDHPAEALRALDAELATTIERLQRARMELGLILRQSAPTDLPPQFATAGADTPMSDADRSVVTVMGSVLGLKGMAAWTDLMNDPLIDPAGEAFDQLPADAPRGEDSAKKTVGSALREICNDAQMDVLRRLAVLLAAAPKAASEGRSPRERPGVG